MFSPLCITHIGEELGGAENTNTYELVYEIHGIHINISLNSSQECTKFCFNLVLFNTVIAGQNLADIFLGNLNHANISIFS